MVYGYMRCVLYSLEALVKRNKRSSAYSSKDMSLRAVIFSDLYLCLPGRLPCPPALCWSCHIHGYPDRATQVIHHISTGGYQRVVASVAFSRFATSFSWHCIILRVQNAGNAAELNFRASKCPISAGQYTEVCCQYNI